MQFVIEKEIKPNGWKAIKGAYFQSLAGARAVIAWDLSRENPNQRFRVAASVENIVDEPIGMLVQ